jgi:hypothetical protein
MNRILLVICSIVLALSIFNCASIKTDQKIYSSDKIENVSKWVLKLTIKKDTTSKDDNEGNAKIYESSLSQFIQDVYFYLKDNYQSNIVLDDTEGAGIIQFSRNLDIYDYVLKIDNEAVARIRIEFVFGMAFSNNPFNFVEISGIEIAKLLKLKPIKEK